MSEAIFSNLPRFDVVAGPRPAEWLRAMIAGEETHAPAQLPEMEEPEPLFADEPMPAQPAVVHPVPRETVALQAAVSGLAGLMERIDQESRQYAVETAQAVAAQLFPELSRRFLAEEIGRNLPGLLPSAAPVVDIYAEPELAAQMVEMVSRHPSLEGRCNIIPSEDQGFGRAEVSWRTGGVTFDFEGLLTACLNDIGSTYKTTTEHK
ncbi:MAG: hypothetical protein C0456_13090 [Hyphomonas sp.]|uniref:hypothetical protein n=1 Tax=Hyphomonas sp. TaxID=87 RepID=UPI001D91E9A9|nr:hypothetical protein [Hyphomonas sp.]MBA4227557.1 hypothetical protein [Hyphomonas sp.]